MSKPQGQGSMLILPDDTKKRFIPSASITDYDKSASSRPGSVFGIRVHFQCQSAFLYSICASCYLFIK